MIRQLLFVALLFGSCAYALAKGTRDARTIAVTTLGATIVSYLLVSRYADIELGVLAVDVASGPTLDARVCEESSGQPVAASVA